MSKPGPRPFTRAQALQNNAFLRALRRTGNAKAAAREVGAPISTLGLRRRTHPAFGDRWDAALVVAQARLRGDWGGRPRAGADALRTRGGEPVVQRGRDGRLQLRAALPGRLTKAAEQAFLSALSVTANVRLAAAAAGASFTLFYRRRDADPGFAREWRLALDEGCRRLEEALVAGFMPDAGEDDSWRHNDAPAMPSMTAAQALQLLYLHHQGTRAARRDPFRPRRDEPREVLRARLAAAYRQRVLDQAENAVTDVLAMALPIERSSRHETPPVLPDLDQVTGWSTANPAATPYGDEALFGGFRAEHQTPAQRAAFRAGRKT